MTQTITRLFDSFDDARHAVIELERVGIPHGDISVVSSPSDMGHGHAAVHTRRAHDHTTGEAVAGDAAIGATAGGVVGAVGGALAGLGLLAIPGLGPVVAAGWLVSAAVGAVVGGAAIGAAGGIVGALTNAGVGEAEAHVYAESVRRGGTLVTAKVRDDEAPAVEAALKDMPAVDVAARGADYRRGGWDRFDERAHPYTPDEIELDQQRYVSADR
jgi:hypothetical protein